MKSGEERSHSMLEIVATPIGNLGDISTRAKTAFEKADLIACEDTRQTKKLCALLGLSVRAKLLAYHDHNGAQMRPKLLQALTQGQHVVLVSDAGTPLISDPGYKLVEACHEQQIPVSSLPGPSAPITALTLSGLPSDRFMFHGFLPTSSSQLKAQLSDIAGLEITHIWFESPRRLPASLSALQDMLGNRMAVVARELTKLHEEIRRAPLSDLVAHYQVEGPPKGEIVLLVDGRSLSNGQSAEDITVLLEQALSEKSLKDAVLEITSLTGLPKRQIYQKALALTKKD